jgi:hypothetical protein
MKVAVIERDKGKDVRVEVPEALIRAALAARQAYEAAMRELVRAVDNGGWKPGFDGTPPEIVHEVRPNDNPQLTPVRNVLEHPLDLMYHRKQISFSQWSAGDQLRADLELSHIAPMRGTDYNRIFASSVPRQLERAVLEQTGGRPLRGPVTFRPKSPKRQFSCKPVDDVTLSAIDRVLAARAHVAERLSAEHFEIPRLIIGERKTLGQIGAMAGLGHRNTAGKRFRTTLDCLADHYGHRWGKL